MQTTNTDVYLGRIIEGFISWVDGINLTRLTPKIRHYTIRHQLVKHISVIPQA